MRSIVQATTAGTGASGIDGLGQLAVGKSAGGFGEVARVAAERIDLARAGYVP